MRHTWLTCTLLLLVLPPVTTAAPLEAPPAAKLFESTQHDFGTVPRGAQLFHRFTWTNTERTRREITEVRSTCGCLTATPVPRVVEPGQKGSIEVLMDGRRFVGQKHVTIHLMIGPDHPQAVVLQASAHSRTDVVFNPGEIAFGVLPEGATVTQTIEIEYAGPQDWRILEILPPGPHLDATFEESYRKPGQVGYRLKVALKPSAPAGDFKHMVQLKTNDPANPLLSVLAEATVRPSLVIIPDPVYFGSVRVGQTLNRRVTLRSDRPFQILRVDGLSKDLVLTPPTNAAAVQSLTINWKPEEAGELNAEIILQTDLERYPQVRLRVQGEAMP